MSLRFFKALGFIIVLLFGVNAVGRAQAQPLLTHHLREEVVNDKMLYVRPLQANKMLRLDLVLSVRNRDELEHFAQDVSNPTSSSFRHFLSVAEFTERFGPSQEDYNTVLHFAKKHGFKVVGGSREGMDVQVEAPVRTIEKAFHVSMQLYQSHKEKRQFYSPDREPLVDLPFQLWHITGLDNYSKPHPLYKKRETTPSATTGSGPEQAFLGSDMRAAYYGVDGPTALTGRGQNLGLFEFYGTNLSDLDAYFRNIGQTNLVPITLFSTDGTDVTCDPSNGCDDDLEQTIDMTQALGMAPGLSSLVMYIGSDDTSIFSAMVSHNPLPTTIGCSWGWTPVDPEVLNPYFLRMAAQGQTFFAASGDDSTWTTDNYPWPAESPYVVTVGGTDLTTVAPGGAWQSETTWTYSGGGISPNHFPIPAWQTLPGVINVNNQGSIFWRNGPDVAANADFTFYACGNGECTSNHLGGTSFAAPMWAGYIALANEQSTVRSNTTVGFINPTLYSIGIWSIYSLIFHDITMGTSGSYSAVPGYDLVTGWGSMNGAALINYLAG